MNVYILQTQSRLVLGVFATAQLAENERDLTTGDSGTVMKWPVEE